MKAHALQNCDQDRILREDLRSLTPVLGRLLAKQRSRGRTPLSDAVGGAVIESGEAEGLLHELETDAPDLQDDPLHPPAPLSPSLIHLARAFDLQGCEWDAVLMALGVELDGRLARLIAYLNDHVSHTRPTLGLLQSLAETGQNLLSLPRLLDRPLFRDGLLDCATGLPLPNESFRLSPMMLRRICALESFPDYNVHAVDPTVLNRIVLPDVLREKLDTWVDNYRAQPSRQVVLISGPAGSGKTVMAHALASAIGLTLIEIPIAEDFLRAARRESRWFTAAILLVAAQDKQPDWRAIHQLATGLPYPVFVEIPPTLKAEALSAAQGMVTAIDLQMPTIGDRARIWEASVGNDVRFASTDWLRLADRFPVSPKQLRSFVALAHGPESADAIEVEFRQHLAGPMSALAERLPLTASMDELVVPERVRKELRLAVAWINRRQKVLTEWKLGEKITAGRGLTALFHGPPGTGKTMMAQVLARELRVELFRVDLSQVMSKYIGETERNLARLFDAAQDSGAMLFFDEGDALFGKRSEVKDAHDRYANVEIGYLLQRMEQHDGVTVVATNRLRDLDEAFVRRFHFITELQMPDEIARERIWRDLLPKEATIDPKLDIAAFARRFELSGGEIKNCVLAAAFLAAMDRAAIGATQIAYSIRRELEKNGRLVDESQFDDLVPER